MITNREIANTYLAYKGLVLTKNKKRDDVRFLIPFYLMDVSYQIYCKEIKDYDCKHKVKQIKSRWKESYRKFYADFFRAFNQEQIDFIIDQMDEFENYIHNKVVMLKSAVMEVLPSDAPFEERKILSSVFTSNVLSQYAQHGYAAMYRNSMLQKKDNPLIEAVTKNSYEFAHNFPAAKSIDITSTQKISEMVTLIGKDVCKYLDMKFNAEQN